MVLNVRFSNGQFHSYRHLWNWPFENQTSQHRTWKCSVFEWIRFSNGRYSSPDCIKLINFYVALWMGPLKACQFKHQIRPNDLRAGMRFLADFLLKISLEFLLGKSGARLNLKMMQLSLLTDLSAHCIPKVKLGVQLTLSTHAILG